MPHEAAVVVVLRRAAEALLRAVLAVRRPRSLASVRLWQLGPLASLEAAEVPRVDRRGPRGFSRVQPAPSSE